jgi:hypothetical protein
MIILNKFVVLEISIEINSFEDGTVKHIRNYALKISNFGIGENQFVLVDNSKYLMMKILENIVSALNAIY